MEGIDNSETKKKTGRGGKRLGAGRKPGKWPLAKGKRKTNSICCYVTDELKAEFLRQAEAKHMSQTEYIAWLIKEHEN